MNKGLKIKEIIKGSIASMGGIKEGDIILSINGNPVNDEIDLIFHGSDEILNTVIKRDEKRINITLRRKENMELGIIPEPMKIKTCKNRCIFCFVSQLPPKMRRSLYIKDDDYRMSFLYGNFITLTNLTEEEKKRIVKQGLSPLYISVHTTNKEIRNIMLGNPDAPDIIEEIKFFAKNRIRLHTQIVLCPGYNDGDELKKTIRDLYRFYPYVESIGVVPVGLTRFRTNLREVTKYDAINAIKIINQFQKIFKRRHGKHIIYAADELYIKAKLPIPRTSYFDDFPQFENGIGMVALFNKMASKVKFPKLRINKKNLCTVTGISFYPFLKRFLEKIKEKTGIDIQIFGIENRFFGNTVTVTGLITGMDILRTLIGNIDKDTYLLIPDVMLKEKKDTFLDDLTTDDISRELSVKVFPVESTPQGLINALEVINEN